MRILIVADTRSPHAEGWIAGVREAGHEVAVFPTFDGVANALTESRRSSMSSVKQQLPAWLGAVVLTLEALTKLPARKRELRRLLTDFRPDLVHGLRIPYEGLSAIAGAKSCGLPLVVSVWGIDFSRQAAVDPLLRSWMRRALPHLDGVHVDEEPDLARAAQFGARPRATLVAAANFGMRPRADLPQKLPRILAPRGFNERMNSRVMLEGLTEFARRTDFRGEIVFLNTLRTTHLEKFASSNPDVTLTFEDWVPVEEFRAYTATSRVVLSPAMVDGMPVSVLEALVAGAVPVTFDHLPQFIRLRDNGSRLVTVSAAAGPTAYADAIQQAWDLSYDETPVSLPEEYDWEENLRRVSNFYASVMRESPGP